MPDRYQLIRSAARLHGYSFWCARPYDLFLFGIRNKVETNLFDDVVGCAYFDDERQPVVETWKATTDPGRKSLDNPTREAGTATVALGQWRRIWTRGMHRGKYSCLVPAEGAVIPVYRGHDYSKIYTDSAGIQLHHANKAARVDWYSAGCLVLWDPTDLSRALALYDLQKTRLGFDRVSLTMFSVEQNPELAALLP